MRVRGVLVALALARCAAPGLGPAALPGHQPARRQRLELPPQLGAPVPGRPRARDVRRHDGLVEPDLAAPQASRLLRLRARLRRPRHRSDRGVGGPAARLRRPVLAATGARKVSLVGHSQGGMMPRYYVKFLGRRRQGRRPDRAGALEPRRRATPARWCSTARRLLLVRPAGHRLGVPDQPQRRGRDARQRRLHAVETRYDEVVIPYTSAFLVGRDQRAAPGRAARSTWRAPVDHLRRGRAALGPERARPPRPGRPASVPRAACRL